MFDSECKIRRLAILDDDEATLSLLRRKFQKFNSASKWKVYVDYYIDPIVFLKEFDHDWALVDLNLDNSEMDGFDVARNILEKHEATAIVTSTDIDTDEDLESLLPKKGIRASEIFQRFYRLDINKARNVLQIFMRAAEREDGRDR